MSLGGLQNIVEAFEQKDTTLKVVYEFTSSYVLANQSTQRRIGKPKSRCMSA